MNSLCKTSENEIKHEIIIEKEVINILYITFFTGMFIGVNIAIVLYAGIIAGKKGEEYGQIK